MAKKPDRYTHLCSKILCATVAYAKKSDEADSRALSARRASLAEALQWRQKSLAKMCVTIS